MIKHILTRVSSFWYTTAAMSGVHASDAFPRSMHFQRHSSVHRHRLNFMYNRATVAFVIMASSPGYHFAAIPSSQGRIGRGEEEWHLSRVLYVTLHKRPGSIGFFEIRASLRLNLHLDYWFPAGCSKKLRLTGALRFSRMKIPDSKCELSQKQQVSRKKKKTSHRGDFSRPIGICPEHQSSR